MTDNGDRTNGDEREESAMGRSTTGEGPMTTDTFTYTCPNCGGQISVERGQELPHDYPLVFEITSALIRHGNHTLVRLERTWDARDRWVVEADRARSASGYVREQVIDGWEQASNVAAELARDVLAHEMAERDAADRLLARWSPHGVPDNAKDGSP